jgi:hypothetical protein
VSVAGAVNWLGMSEYFSGEFLRAQTTFQESVALAAAVRSPLWLGSALTFLGATLDQLGRPEESRAALDEASVVAGRVGHAQADNWHWRSVLALHTGRVDDAAEMVERSMAGPRAATFLFGSMGRLHRAEVMQARGENEATRETLEKVIARFREFDARWVLARALLVRSRAERALGDGASSARALRDAIDVARRFGDRATIVDLLEWSATIAVEDDPSVAGRLIGAAARIRRETGYAVHPVARPMLDALWERIGGGGSADPQPIEPEPLSDSDALTLAASVA